MNARITLLGTLAAAMIALGAGCQVPVTSIGPRAVVLYDTLKWNQDADLAITLDFRALLGKKGYLVQQVASPAPGLKRIVAKVTGPNIVGELEAAVDTMDCATGIATINFDHLPPGPVHVVVNAIGYDDKVISWGANDVAITPNATAAVPVVCQAADGKLAVTFECSSLCTGASPTPTPTPTPMPTPYVMPSGEPLSGAAGFAVGPQGETYVFAGVPGLAQFDIVKFSKSLERLAGYTQSADYKNNQGCITEGEIVGTTFYAHPGGTYSHVTLDLTQAAPQAQIIPDSAVNVIGWYGKDFYTPSSWNPLTNHVIYAGTANEDGFAKKTSIYYFEEPRPASYTPYYFSGDPTRSMSYSAQCMSWATDLNQPIWSSEWGIATLPGAVETPPTRLLPGPWFGLLPLAGKSTELFLTRYGYVSVNTPQIFYYNAQTQPQPIPVTTFSYGYPRQIERGADGNLYAMLIEGNYAGTGAQAGSFMANEPYRIVRLEWNNDPVHPALTPVQLMVDYFSVRTPSW